MAAVDWFAHAEVAEPVTAPRRRPPARRPAAPVRSRRKATQRRVRGHIVWMTLFAILLFGVVALNVAVLRAHVAVSRLGDERARIEAAARRLGLIQASAGNTSYLDLMPRGR